MVINESQTMSFERLPVLHLSKKKKHYTLKKSACPIEKCGAIGYSVLAFNRYHVLGGSYRG